MPHGAADRLLNLDIDFNALDEVLRHGGEAGDIAERLGVGNDFLGPKRFGKMFPDATPFRPPDEALINLGQAMRETVPTDPSLPPDPSLDNPDVPAGFTYFGQFVDHDITFDQTKGFPPINDPEEIEQARTPNLDLDSLYGLGPKRQPELYDASAGLLSGLVKSTAKFRIGHTSSAPSAVGQGQALAQVSLPHDLPRRDDKVAIIGDPRNDENLIVAQLHLAFLRFHNRVMEMQPQKPDLLDELSNFTQSEEDRKKTPFHTTRRLVRWHYQFAVLNDFLPRIVEPSVLNDVRANGRKFFTFQKDPFRGRPYMPIEFSVAAYRFGHSMVREVYNHNRVFASPSVVPNPLAPGLLAFFFRFTGSGGFNPPHVTLPSNWIVDWRRFFPVADASLLNHARLIDTKLVPTLHKLPGIQPPEPNDLAVRNLLRGSRLGLPTGQQAAEIMGLQKLTPDQIATGADGEVAKAHGFHEQTPFWYYVLKEAEVLAGGRRLGPVGSRIVAEVFVGLLEGDKNSFLAKKKDWMPTLPAATPGTFTMADLLRFVGDVNPLGD